jgi:hypothetical protein
MLMLMLMLMVIGLVAASRNYTPNYEAPQRMPDGVNSLRCCCLA